MTDLKALSDAATQGEWGHDGYGREVWLEADGDPIGVGYEGEIKEADAAFICALVNEYRAGRLVPAAALAEATEDSLAPLDDMATRRLQGEVERLRAALHPFSEMAGEMFARNWERGQVAFALDNPGEPHRLVFDDFLAARAALASIGTPVASPDAKDGA